jgi:hypothetical protein
MTTGMKDSRPKKRFKLVFKSQMLIERFENERNTSCALGIDIGHKCYKHWDIHLWYIDLYFLIFRIGIGIAKE